MRVLPVGIGIIGDFNFLFAYLNFLNVHYGKGEMGPFFLIKKKKITNVVTFFLSLL